MTLKFLGVGAAVALGLGASASAGGKAPSPSKPTVVCSVELNVTDNDPKGLNVRSSPEVRPDNIRSVIKPADWTLVHVTGMSGDWYEIDHYTSYVDNGDDTEHDVKGGWVHMSKLGDVRVWHGGRIFAAPSERGKPIYTFGPDEYDVTVLGCQGAWLKVKYHNTVGWSGDICTNERTTCV